MAIDPITGRRYRRRYSDIFQTSALRLPQIYAAREQQASRAKELELEEKAIEERRASTLADIASREATTREELAAQKRLDDLRREQEDRLARESLEASEREAKRALPIQIAQTGSTAGLAALKLREQFPDLFTTSKKFPSVDVSGPSVAEAAAQEPVLEAAPYSYSNAPGSFVPAAAPSAALPAAVAGASGLGPSGVAGTAFGGFGAGYASGTGAGTLLGPTGQATGTLLAPTGAGAGAGAGVGAGAGASLGATAAGVGLAVAPVAAGYALGQFIKGRKLRKRLSPAEVNASQSAYYRLVGEPAIWRTLGLNREGYSERAIGGKYPSFAELRNQARQRLGITSPMETPLPARSPRAGMFFVPETGKYTRELNSRPRGG